MTLEEAIEEVGDNLPNLKTDYPPYTVAALLLLIEAGKEVKKHRTLWDMVIASHLPGETED